jgi:hypothetical protein
MKKALLIVVLMCVSFGLNAQKEIDLDAHKTISYLGANISKPIFIGKDQEALGYWQGLQLKSGIFFMQAQWGRTIDKQADSSRYIGRAFMFNWGMRFSAPTTKPGKMTLGTFSIQPKIDFGICFAHMPHDTIVRGFNYPMSLGMHMSPGVIMRASSIYVLASCDVDIIGSVEPIFKKEEKHFNMGRGIIITPTLTIGFDNGWELLAPTIRKGSGTYTETTFHYTGESWTTRYDPAYGGYVSVHTTRGYTTSQKKAYSYQFRRIDGYLGLGPVLEFYTNANIGQTQMLGGKIGAVVGPLRIEGAYTTGVKGMGNGVRDEYVESAQYNGARINYTSSVNATAMYGKIGFNLAHLLYPKNDFKSSYDSRTRILGTTFYGFTLYYKYGQMTFNGSPQYTFEGAEQSLDALFSTGLAEASAATDARMLPATTIMKGFGCSIDFGMVSVGIERLEFDDAPIANGIQGTLSVMLPVRKIVHMSRLRMIDRRNEKNK